MFSRATILAAAFLLAACRQEAGQVTNETNVASANVVPPAPLTPGEAPAIRVSDAWIVPSPHSAAIYMTIRNGGGGDTLRAVEAKDLGMIMLHQSSNDGGVMRMRMLASIPVPAHGEVKLAPMGLHAMIEPLARPLRPGDEARLTLHFERQGEVALTAPIRAPGARR